MFGPPRLDIFFARIGSMSGCSVGCHRIFERAFAMWIACWPDPLPISSTSSPFESHSRNVFRIGVLLLSAACEKPSIFKSCSRKLYSRPKESIIVASNQESLEMLFWKSRN